MKENQRIVISKRMLREAMLRLLQTKKLPEINITELCREAEINRATFYKYYNTPQDVLVDVGMELMNDMKKIYRTPKTCDKLKEYLTKLCEYMYQNAELLRLLIRCNSDSEIAIAISGIQQNIYEEKNHIVMLKEADESTLHLTAAFLGGGSYFLIRQWLMEEPSKTPQEIADLILGLLNFGLYENLKID